MSLMDTYPPVSPHRAENFQGCQALGVGEQMAFCIVDVGHGAKFVDGEGFAVQSGSLLAEENGRAKFAAHEQRHYRQQRRE